ncbi:MAG: sigma-70 family RNA polymerase sigma factor [Phycisphaerae bacterium]|nr:sigma-70 family RNA polymerase sigma factor [Gemmatimonadaceae bacterium]
MSSTFATGFALSPAGRTQYVGGIAELRTIPSGARSFGFLVPPGHATLLPINEDAELVAAMARQDERAAARFYDKYSAAMFGLAVRIVGEGADAEDVVLDAFTQAWSHAARYESNRGSVLGWLTTITRTRALDCVRSRGRRTKAVDAASRSMGDDPVAVAGAPVTAPEVLELGERAAAVTSAMAVLPGHQRNAIELAFFEGLTHSEIAERLGEPLGTIKTRIRLGMQRLRDVLQSVPQGVHS